VRKRTARRRRRSRCPPSLFGPGADGWARRKETAADLEIWMEYGKPRWKSTWQTSPDVRS